MNVVICGPAFPYRGGLASYNERLAKQLINEGHDVNIMTFSLQYPSFLFPGKSQFSDSLPPSDLKIERRVNSVNPFNWISVGLRIRKLKPDILIFKFWIPLMAPCFGTIARIAASNKHTRIICIFDNVIPHEKRPGDLLLTKYFTGSIHGGIVMSQSVSDDLCRFRTDIPVRLNPHPLFDNFGTQVEREVAIEKLNLDKRFTYLLFFGFIRAYKGLDLLIEAFAKVHSEKPDLKLVIAGEFYEDDLPYRELVKKYNLGNDVIFFDRFISDEEVNLYFGLADLVVLPYKSATQSGVTQIAYHFEKPMLVTDVGGLREIVADGKCGYVVSPDAESITSAIEDFFNNKRKDQFIAGIKDEKKRFSWNRLTGALMDIYNECSGEK